MRRAGGPTNSSRVSLRYTNKGGTGGSACPERDREAERTHTIIGLRKSKHSAAESSRYVSGLPALAPDHRWQCRTESPAHGRETRRPAKVPAHGLDRFSEGGQQQIAPLFEARNTVLAHPERPGHFYLRELASSAINSAARASTFLRWAGPSSFILSFSVIGMAFRVEREGDAPHTVCRVEAQPFIFP